MKIVVIGGSGLIGSKTVERLRIKGHDVVAASPNSGVDTISGKGVADALAGAQVVVDVANSPSFDDEAVMAFFRTSGNRLLAEGRLAGVKHHIALSIVGTERLQGSGYMRAKMVQEELIRQSGIPFTIVHSTQFFEFMGGIAQGGTIGNTVHLSPAFVQPIASDEVADVMADIALGKPANGTIEIAGPDKVRLTEIMSLFLKETGDARVIVTDPHARYFGVELDDNSLIPGPGARFGKTRYQDWLPLNLPPKR